MTSISKNVYIIKLDDIVNEYNNTYHRLIKMKPVHVKNNTYIDSSKKVDDNDPKFRVGDRYKFQNRKISLLKDTLQTGLKKFM